MSQTASTGAIDRHAAEQYPAGLYQPARNVKSYATLGEIDDAAIAEFHEVGYLSVDRALSLQMVEDARAGISHLVAGGNEEFKGRMFEAGAKGKDLDAMTDQERFALVRKIAAFCKYDDRLDRVMRDPGIVGVMERIIGDEPSCIQEMALLKPPGGREKPWHQDNAYFAYKLGVPIIGAWIALDDATIENGCMHLVEATHREPMIHFQRRDWQICDTDMLGRDMVAAPLPAGGALFFSGMLLHGTPTNHSNVGRRALQFHYGPMDAKKDGEEDRLANFGSEGKDVEC